MNIFVCVTETGSESAATFKKSRRYIRKMANIVNGLCARFAAPMAGTKMTSRDGALRVHTYLVEKESKCRQFIPRILCNPGHIYLAIRESQAYSRDQPCSGFANALVSRRLPFLRSGKEAQLEMQSSNVHAYAGGERVLFFQLDRERLLTLWLNGSHLIHVG